MADSDRRDRDLELLRKSRQALHDDQNQVDRPVAEAELEGDSGTMMYRGKAIRTGGSGPKVPGAGAGRPVPGATGFRGAGRKSSGASSSGQADIKQLLQKLSDLRAAGLITKAEYDKKKSQILDRL